MADDTGITLHVEGLTDDQDHLVLTDDDGEHFHLAVDEATATIASRSPARTASRYAAATESTSRERSKETSMATADTLAPRDIQARIRAGASVDDVIAESAMERDRVERYAGPMLAERSHVASLARGTEIRRDMASDVALARAVSERLKPLGVDEGTADWDSWRRDDGRWVVRIAYSFGRDERSGHWVFDPRAGSLVADDAEARWLIDPSAAEPAADQRASKPRLASVVALAPSAPADDDANLSAAPVSDHSVEPDEAPPVDDVDDVDDDANDALHALEEHSTHADDDGTDEVLVLAEQVQATLDDLVDEPPVAKPKRKGRAAVPSWDDIVFGSRTPQE